MGSEAESGTVMGRHAAGRPGTGLDLVQGAREQPAGGQQGINGRDSKGNRSRFATSLDAVRPFQTPYFFPQGSRDQNRRIVGGPGR